MSKKRLKQISLIDSINEVEAAQKSNPPPISKQISLKELSIRLRTEPDLIHQLNKN